MPIHFRAPRIAALALSLPLAAHATNGYFAEGYGARSQGQAGTAIALSQDSLVAAVNPAGIAFAGERLDLGVDWFRPSRGASINGNAFGADAAYDGDGKKDFFIPHAGYVAPLSSTLTAGIAVYGNGGLDTQYETNPYGRFGAGGTAGVDLEQLFVTPSLAWKPAQDQALGVGVTLAYQRFSAQGIGFFSGFSAAPSKVSDQGTDTSLGAGLKLGWVGALAPGVTAGASWSSRIRGKFDHYRGLFAGGGRFDVPDNFGAGIALRPDAQWIIAADVQRINYGHVAAVGDGVALLLQGVPLGADNGPGFGWRNITVLKFGASYQVDPAWTLRAGYSHAAQAVPASETFFTILAPGVVQDHFTAGATWAPSARGEWSGFLAYAPPKSVQGSASIPPGLPPGGFGGGEANVHLKETVFGITYAWKW